MTETQWKRRDDLKAAWKAFIQTEAFEAAISILKDRGTPFLNPAESLENLAKRQAYLAGFNDCIKMLQIIPELTTKESHDAMLHEWSWVKPSEGSTK